MSKNLFFQAVFKYTLGVLIVGCLIFIPAGTLTYINGWIFMVILFLPIFIAGLVMMIKNPKLLASRLDGKEKQRNQSLIIKLSGVMFIVGFIVAGLDFRFKWFTIPMYISYIAAGIILFFYLLWAEILRENTYLSRTIKVEEGQKVIDKLICRSMFRMQCFFLCAWAILTTT